VKISQTEAARSTQAVKYAKNELCTRQCYIWAYQLNLEKTRRQIADLRKQLSTNLKQEDDGQELAIPTDQRLSDILRNWDRIATRYHYSFETMILSRKLYGSVAFCRLRDFSYRFWLGLFAVVYEPTRKWDFSCVRIWIWNSLLSDEKLLVKSRQAERKPPKIE
jgi:hypothetical protein